MNLIKKDKEYVANTYNRQDVAFKYGKGSTLYDYNDNPYIDFTSGIGVNIFGFNDEGYKKAINDQLNCLQHTSNLYYTEPCATLAEQLCKRTNMKKVFFGNSGAEANEGALKAARKYSFDKYGADRYEVISLVDSFHGRTMATLTLTGQDKFHKYFNPFLDGVKYSLKTMEDIKNTVSEKTCAIIIEAIQGEAGVMPLDFDFVKELEYYCNEKDILLICDEVQAGNGRCGVLYSYMAYNINPDIVTTAKGLAGGLPIGAVLLGNKVENTFKYGDHGSTFGGNPISCSAANYVLSKINDELLSHVLECEKYIRSELEGFEISGMGLMLGISVPNNQEVLVKCKEQGLLVLTAGNKIRLLPPLNISFEELQKGISILKGVISE